MPRHRLTGRDSIPPVTLALLESAPRAARGQHRAAPSSSAHSLTLKTGTVAALAGVIGLGAVGAAQATAKPPSTPTAPTVALPGNLTLPPELAPENLDKLPPQLEDLARNALPQLPPNVGVPGTKRAVAPTTGTVTSGYGSRWGTHHYGVDIANRVGTPIYAVTDGTVLESGPASGFGMWVRIRQDDGTTGVYGHVNESFVKAGQKVVAGQKIATVGNRGQSTGPHLHYEVWSKNGTKINPQVWLAKRGVHP